jgi:hypothetical protein
MSHPPKQSLNDYIAMVDAGRKAPALTPAEMQAALTGSRIRTVSWI